LQITSNVDRQPPRAASPVVEQELLETIYDVDQPPLQPVLPFVEQELLDATGDFD